MRIRWKSRRGQRKEATWVSRSNWRRWSQQAENMYDQSSFAIPCNIISLLISFHELRRIRSAMCLWWFSSSKNLLIVDWYVFGQCRTISLATTTFKSGFVEFVNWKNSSMKPEPEWEPGPLSNNTLEGICGQGRCCQSCLCRTSSTNTNTNTFFWNYKIFFRKHKYKYLLLKIKLQIPAAYRTQKIWF